MSNKNKLNWFVLLVLVGLMGYLVALSFVRSGTANNGLECVYNYDGYNVMLDSLKPSNGLKMSLAGYSSDDRLQPTQPVQKTQSSAMLHELSIGVEMRPLEMLREGRF